MAIALAPGFISAAWPRLEKVWVPGLQKNASSHILPGVVLCAAGMGTMVGLELQKLLP